MCDSGENVRSTMMREFLEEATDCLGKNKSTRKQTENNLQDFFKKGEEVKSVFIYFVLIILIHFSVNDI